MAGEVVVEPAEFEDFFEASFDTVTQKDFIKFYPRIKKLTLDNLRGKGVVLFEIFLSRLGFSEFDPETPEGAETFSILHACLDKDKTVLPSWPKLLSQYPHESALFLDYLSRNARKVKSAKQIKSQLLQSNELALSSVKHVDLLEAAKHFQHATQKQRRCQCVALSRAMGLYVLILSIIALLWLDIAENGKGSFSRSHVGQLLSSYQVLDDFLLIWEHISFIFNIVTTHVLPLFQYGYNGLLPLFYFINDLFYIPDFVGFTKYLLDKSLNCFGVLGNQVFVGALSPENLRKMTKEGLSFLWSNMFYLLGRTFGIATQVVAAAKGYF